MTRWLRLVAVLLLTALLAGCWSRRELTDVSFAGALGIDWVENEYQISLTIISPRRQAAEGGAPTQSVWTIAERAPAIDAALAKLDQILQRFLTLSHIRAIIFGEEMARRGIGPSIDYLLRTVEVRPTAWVGVTVGEAFDLLQAAPTQERVSTDGPLGYQDLAQKRSSNTPARRITQVSNILQEEGIDLTLPLFRLGNEAPPNAQEAEREGALHSSEENALEIIYGGAGVFHGDQLVGWLTPEAARGHLWGTDQIVHGAISAQCPTPKANERVVFRLRKGRGNTETFLQNGKLRGVVSVYVIVDVNEITCTERVLFDSDLSELESLVAGRIRSDIGKAIAVTRSTGADVFGFGQNLFRRAPADFAQRQKDWPETLQEMPITVEITARVSRMGQLNRRYRWDPAE